MRKLNPMTNKERLAFITEKLGGIDSRLITNWLIEDVKMTHTPRGHGRTYVRVTLNNLNGITFFGDLKDVEKTIRSKIRGSWNFAVMKSSPSKPKISFCID